MFSVDLFSLKKCFGVLRDNYQTNSSVRLGTIHLGQRLAPLPLVHRSPGVNQRWELFREFREIPPSPRGSGTRPKGPCGSGVVITK